MFFVGAPLLPLLPENVFIMAFSLFETVLKVQKAFSKNNIAELRELSNLCGDNLVLEPNTAILDLSILSYALSKLSEKQHILKDKSWTSFSRSVEKNLRKCLDCEKSGDAAVCDKILVDTINSIGVLESRDKRYVRGIVDKARLKIASRLYAQGVSLGNASQITGALRRDISHYSGKTMMHDRAGVTKNIGQRLKHVRRIFGKKGMESE